MIKKCVEPVKRLVQLSISQCTLATVDDSKGIQTVQIGLLAEEIQEVERFQNYGFTSHPILGAEGVAVFVGGNREHGVVVAMDDRAARKKGNGPGSVTMYDVFGTEIILDAQGNIQMNGVNIVVGGKLTVELGAGTQEKILNGETFQQTFNTHTHTVFGVPTTPVNVLSTPLDLSQAVTAATLPAP